GVGQGPQVFVGDLGQLEVAEPGLQVPLIDRAPHVAGEVGHRVAAKPLFRPGTERLGVAHTGLLPGFLPGRRLPRRDHLLGFGQAFPGLGQRDPARPVPAEGDGLLAPVEGVVVAERCPKDPARNYKNSFYTNHLHDSDTMTTWERGAWHRRRGMAQGRFRAIDYAMKNSCWATPQAASPCQD